MEELILKRDNENNVILQTLDYFADLVSEKIEKRIREFNENNRVISIKPKTLKSKEIKEKLLTVKEVCKILNIKRGTLYSWKKKHLLLPDTYIGISPRYKENSINEYINSCKR